MLAFRIENRTGQDIHVRVFADGKELLEESGHWVATGQMKPAGGSREQGGLAVRQKRVVLFHTTSTLLVEESNVLKTVRSFPVGSFFSHPDRGFRLIVRKTGMEFVQDLEIARGDQPTAAELRAAIASAKVAERAAPTMFKDFLIINRSGVAIDVTLLADDRPLADVTLPATLPPQTQGIKGSSDRYPYDVQRPPLELRARRLTVRVAPLGLDQTFNIAGWQKNAPMFRVQVLRGHVVLEKGMFAW